MVHTPRPTSRHRALGILAATGGAAAMLALRVPQLASAQTAADPSASPAPSASPVPCLVDASPSPSSSLAPVASPLPSAMPCASPEPSLAPSPVAQVTLTGQPVETRFGTVQVQVLVQGSTILDVQPVQMPNDRPRSLQISQIVTPMLHDEVIQAQSSNIDVISGATWTSRAYEMSLQSALDQRSV
jgi:uncharacterized protein with FMN-binding domain